MFVFRTTILSLFAAWTLLFAEPPITLSVDLTDAPRRLTHASLSIPAKPGPLTLLYPKWVPGEHGPTGPIADLVDLEIKAGGKPLAWRRDPVDMYAFHCEVPPGAASVDVSLSFVSPPKTEGFSSGASATTELAVLSWNQVLLYPAGVAADAVIYKAKLQVPKQWRYATALPVERESGDSVNFAPASLTTLVDSPLLAGRHFRTEDLNVGSAPRHYLHLAADSREALELSQSVLSAYERLVRETGVLFGARHYGRYDFLVTLSDHVAHFGLEHHESSDDRLPEMAMVDEPVRKLHAGLLPHEMAHSWNGKYRRPVGLATPDYQKPMLGELLWVYEGLTTYLGDILTARSGLVTPDEFRQSLALDAAGMDLIAGRRWRPLADTAIGAQVLYGSRDDWSNLRRGVDFYPEGALIWLDADVTIRTLSKGRKSLDDFCFRFFGGQSGAPAVKPYTLEDVISELNAVQPHDWRAFFEERVYRPTPRAPLGGIEAGGWRLVYRESPSPYTNWRQDERREADLTWSIGLSLKDDGTVLDVVPGRAADKAGIAPATQMIAVNGRQFSTRVLRQALAAAKASSEPIELLMKNGEYYRTYRVDCHDGEKYPWLERDSSRPDLLTEIIRPRG
ncbi:MAG TPA: hypothetical protein VLE22_26540 [Bryobacteraceae bacterium]|nr:hypothetical protein [Bryobacteraceae bacterium]